jgi:cysteine-rich repeat protein
VDDGEECDDGNVQPGDGCDAACAWEPWQHEGVAHDIPLDDLHGWTQCWSDDYSGTDERLVSSLADSCDKAQLLVACLPLGSDTLTLAAHAAREDVLFPVDYSGGERHTANNVAWYWSPDDDHVGFGPAGNTTPCIEVGEDQQLCWRTTGGGFADTFTFGRRCGPQLGFTLEDAPTWQRVVFHADAM